MDWSLPNRETYIKKNVQVWTKDHLRLPKGARVTQANIKHKENSSALQMEVVRDGKKERYMMIVHFDGKIREPKPGEGFIYNRAKSKWDFCFDEENLALMPDGNTAAAPISRKMKSFLAALVLICSLAAAATGLPLIEESVRGIKAYGWEKAEGVWNDGWYSYHFRLPGDDGTGEEYSSSHYDARLKVRYGRDMESILGYARRKETQGERLSVFVNPSNPALSVLRPGISPMTAYWFLAFFGLLSMALASGRVLREANRSVKLPENYTGTLLSPLFIYFLSLITGLLVIQIWGYLLRTMPPEWPFLLFGLSSTLLFAFPRIAGGSIHSGLSGDSYI